MPFMIFYQQSATVDKGLTKADLPAARLETAAGCCLTQGAASRAHPCARLRNDIIAHPGIMIAVIVAAAAILHTQHEDLETVSGIATAFTVSIGDTAGLCG